MRLQSDPLQKCNFLFDRWKGFEKGWIKERYTNKNKIGKKWLKFCKYFRITYISSNIYNYSFNQ